MGIEAGRCVAIFVNVGVNLVVAKPKLFAARICNAQIALVKNKHI